LFRVRIRRYEFTANKLKPVDLSSATSKAKHKQLDQSANEPTTPLPLLPYAHLDMSDQKSTAPATIQNNSVMLPTGNGKAAAVAPKLSDDHVEMEDMLPSGPEQSPEEDIMQLARLGDIPGIERLYKTGKFDAQYCDAEGITPLHVIGIDSFR